MNERKYKKGNIIMINKEMLLPIFAVKLTLNTYTYRE